MSQKAFAWSSPLASLWFFYNLPCVQTTAAMFSDCPGQSTSFSWWCRQSSSVSSFPRHSTPLSTIGVVLLVTCQDHIWSVRPRPINLHRPYFGVSSSEKVRLHCSVGEAQSQLLADDSRLQQSPTIAAHYTPLWNHKLSLCISFIDFPNSYPSLVRTWPPPCPRRECALQSDESSRVALLPPVNGSTYLKLKFLNFLGIPDLDWPKYFGWLGRWWFGLFLVVSREADDACCLGALAVADSPTIEATTAQMLLVSIAVQIVHPVLAWNIPC